MKAHELFGKLHSRYYGHAEIARGGTFLVQMRSPLIASGIPAVVTSVLYPGAEIGLGISHFIIRTKPAGEGRPGTPYRVFEDVWFLTPDELVLEVAELKEWQPVTGYNLLDGLEVGYLAPLPDIPHIRAKKAWGGKIPAIEELFLERLIQREGWVAINIGGSEFAFHPSKQGVQALLSEVLPSKIQGLHFYHNRYIVIEDPDMAGALIGFKGENIRVLKEHLGHTLFVVESYFWEEYGQVSRTLACWSDREALALGTIWVMRWVPLWIQPGQPLSLKIGLRCTYRRRGEEECCTGCPLCQGAVIPLKDFCSTS